MHRSRNRWLVCDTVAVVLLFSFVAPAGTVSFEDHARQIEANAVAASSRAEVALEMSLNALANAMASVRDAEGSLVDMLRSADRAGFKAKKRELEAAWKAEADALELVEKVSLYVARCKATAGDVQSLIERAFQADSRRGSKVYVKKADAASRSTAGLAEKAAAIAEKLKQKWLVRVTTPAESETE